LEGQDAEITAGSSANPAADTGFSRRIYVSLHDFNQRVVPVDRADGRDRTSIHRPECASWARVGRFAIDLDHVFVWPKGGPARVPATVLAHRA